MPFVQQSCRRGRSEPPFEQESEVLESFEGHTKKFVKDGVKILPCLNQTKDIQCVDCRICFETEPLLRTKTVIGFLAHGTSKNKVVAKLQKLNIKPKINRTIEIV